MKMMLKQIFFLFCASITILFTGCIKSRKDLIVEFESYPKIKNYKISFDLYQAKPFYKAKTSPTVSFLLKNKHKKVLKIDEWYADEANNIIIFYRKKGSYRWLENPDKLHKLGRRLTMTLNYKNCAYLEKKLNFIKNVPKGQYEYYAKLNLTSISAKTPIYIVTVK